MEVRVDFIYNQRSIVIIGNKSEKISELIAKFIIKAELNKEELCFLYEGKNRRR